MGSDYQIECENCGFKTVIIIGVGMSTIYNRARSVITLLPFKKRKVAKRVVEEYTDPRVYCDNIILQCNKCNHLFSKFYLTLFSGQDKVYETKFACPECRTSNIRMLESDAIESIEDKECPKCQKLALKKTHMRFWD